MPAGAFDHSGGDRPAAGQRGGVVQVVGLVGQVDGAGICSGSLSVVEPGDGRGPPDRPGDAGGLAVQDGAGVVAYPFLGGGVAFAVEAPCGLPDVLENVNEVDHDGDLQGACVGLGGDPVDLVVVAVDEGDPGAVVVRVAAVGLGEDVGDHGCGVGHDAGGQPLVRRHRSRVDLGTFGGVHGQDVRAGPRRGGGVEHGPLFGPAFRAPLPPLGQPGRPLRSGLGGRARQDPTEADDPAI